ncbi:MAG: molybdopterin-dependent oxidoreductase [Pirellulaceae bacterium]|nr:molybdopterin-dependent oxidoreductase [Pirellulaceae bacterium]
MNSVPTLEIVSRRSVCPLDCPDTCSLTIDLQGDRVVGLRGDPQHPMTQGFACVKMAKYPERQHHPERLLYPQRRVGPKGSGQFQTIGWDEALDTIAARTQHARQRYGDSSILPFHYAGTMGLIERDHPLAFFRALGASELDQTICASTASTAWEINYGPGKISVPQESIAQSRLIVLWGINVLRSGSHLVPWLKAARQTHGARIIHIDPYHNETSRFADQHISINVGTDAALALAVGREIFQLGLQDTNYLQQYAAGLDAYRQACDAWTLDRAESVCGVPGEQIQQLAQAIGGTRQTFIKVGYGMSRNEGGGNSVRAVSLLPALTGAWQHVGGGASLSYSGGFQLNQTRYSGLHLRQPDRPRVNQNHLGTVLAERTANGDPRIAALFVFNSNPAAVVPDSRSVRAGLAREDLFTVVLELFPTDTADYADILLPATMFTEHPDLYCAYGHYYLQWADPILTPPGQCRPNSWVFQQLAQRLGLADPVFAMSTAELAADLLASDHPFLHGVTFQQLQREGSARLNIPGDFRPYAHGSHHEDKKIRFGPAPQQLDFVEQPNRQFPLRMISPPGAYIVNTSMGNIPSLLRAAGGEPSVLIHPDDALAANVQDGQTVRIVSQHGQIQRRLQVTTDARRGVAIAVGQWWPKLAPDRKSLNDLTSQRLTDLAGGSTFGNCVVRVERL